MHAVPTNVCFWRNSGHPNSKTLRPLLTRSCRSSWAVFVRLFWMLELTWSLGDELLSGSAFFQKLRQRCFPCSGRLRHASEKIKLENRLVFPGDIYFPPPRFGRAASVLDGEAIISGIKVWRRFHAPLYMNAVDAVQFRRPPILVTQLLGSRAL
jgi:hypothetical protein